MKLLFWSAKKTVSVLFLVAQAIHADDTPSTNEPYDFYWLTFEGVAVNPQNQAKVCEQITPLKATPLVCLPDPTAKICKSIPQHVANQAEALEKWAQHQEANSAEYFEEGIMLADRQWPKEYRDSLSKQDTMKEWEEIISKYYSFAWSHLRKRLSGGDPDKLNDTVQDAKNIFLETLADSRILTKAERKVISEILDECVQEPQINLNFGTVYRNAGLETEVGKELVFRELWAQDLSDPYETARLKIDPRSKIGCALSFSPKTWRDCVAKKPICYETLFHEFAHAMNSCRFHFFSEFRRIEKNQAKTALEDERGNRLLELFEKASEKSEQDGRTLAEALDKSTQCLDVLSAPKSSIPNACGGEAAFNDSVAVKCGIGAHKGYPSQHNEAQSDFWAASALGRYFKRLPNIASRQQAFTDVVAQWCYEIEHHKTSRTSTAENKKKKEETIKALLAQGLTRKKLVELHILQDDKPCLGEVRDDFKKKAGAPWYDPHQDAKIRFDRNYLRNADLRDSLGCTLGKDVAMACSPLGRQQMILPR